MRARASSSLWRCASTRWARGCALRWAPSPLPAWPCCAGRWPGCWAPGPNVLFIALLGWNVGINAGGAGPAGWASGALGMVLSMVGIMLPSTTLTWLATRWGHRNRERRGVRAFKQGMAPVVIGLLLATAWLLGSAHGNPATDWPLWLLTAVCALLVWRTRLHLLWLLGAGALLGALGLV
ncbi:MAG: hypothetical protein B7X79_15725 [Acidovorax sp. 17-64-282]|nr:MAG: hypothetical protein B7X79_15725 [Acidovorax sp. 17-64-282]